MRKVWGPGASQRGDFIWFRRLCRRDRSRDNHRGRVGRTTLSLRDASSLLLKPKYPGLKYPIIAQDGPRALCPRSSLSSSSVATLNKSPFSALGLFVSLIGPIEDGRLSPVCWGCQGPASDPNNFSNKMTQSSPDTVSAGILTLTFPVSRTM